VLSVGHALAPPTLPRPTHGGRMAILLRILRSQRQIAGWAWMPAPAERQQRFGAFGPREDDQPIPAM
ncbi:MAG: hypothetical protein ACRDQI_08015, partial [Pseudonocardiaceae bacterium]